MKSIFDKNTRAEVISRIDTLNENMVAGWGKMTVAQMVKHGALCEEYYYGNIAIKRSFLGRLIGNSAIKAILKNDSSGLKKNAPTLPAFQVMDEGLDLEKEKANWKHLINRYENFNSSNFTHWFFGNMTREQLGQFIYKHTDHHLKQFGA